MILKVFSVFEKHPRIRGESHVCRGRKKDLAETSPHTRGKLVVSVTITSRHGNIPAYAGKASSFSSGYFQVEKHPRIRGESLRYKQSMRQT